MTQSTTQTATVASQIAVGLPSRRDILPLRRLFRQALRHDFQYFPPAYIDLINRQNNWWRLLLARSKADRVIVVAKLHGKIIGYAIGSLTPQHNGELYWLYVDPARRSANVGAALLEATRREMSRRGAQLITLVTYDLRDYYLHHGFSYRGKQRIHGLDLDVMEHGLGGHGQT